MNFWTMDPAIYGLPDHGMSAGQSRTFTQFLGDVGRSRYVKYNSTAPIPVTLPYGWDGATLASFRAAWEDENMLDFGSKWMKITIPAEFGLGDRTGTNVYDCHVTIPFQASLAGYDYWAVVLTVDVDVSPVLVTA